MSTGDAPVTMTPAEVAAAMPTKATTQRDELADLLATSAGWERDSLDEDQADVILAAGYTKPRTVTTVAELDALPVGTVILCAGDLTGELDGDQALTKEISNFQRLPTWHNRRMSYAVDAVLDDYTSITVLYSPEVTL